MAKREVFVREATGLVRSLTPLDAFIVNVAISVGLLGFTFGPATAAFLFPGVAIGQAMIIGVVACIPLAIVYSYYVAKVFRSREGVDLSLVFKQIPPE